MECRGYSPALERTLVDFGADDPFAGAAAKLKEHYGIEVPVSAVRKVTEAHGAAMLAGQKQKSDWPEGWERAGVPVLIAEMDGSMLPVVETAAPGTAEAGVDRRKTRKVSWQEARLALVHEPGSVTPMFGGTLGSVEEAGERLAVCALEAGMGRQTKIHGMGDGAVWVSEQMETQFGAQADYLVDFYHLGEYLSAAADVITPQEGKEKKVWLKEKQDWLKENRWKDVLGALRPFVEDEERSDAEAPVRVCSRYISNRSDSLDYQGALAAGLPIGTGEIESAHHYVFPKRLKLAGGWWKEQNLSKMIALRVLRANGGWKDYWNDLDQKAA